METVTFIILVILFLGLIYCFYQFFRNDAVCEIRISWIYSNDPRYDKYTYSQMFNPSLKNWLGLKFPKEEDFEY